MTIELPTEPTREDADFSGLFTMIYGAPKIGKSTLASTFPEALFIKTEEGLRFLKVFKVGCNSWTDFKGIVHKLREPEAKARYRTIVIDTVDLLYAACETHVCDTRNIAHPSEEDWGRGWTLVRTEFQRGMQRLTGEGYGVVFITHERIAEKEVRGRKVPVTMPSLSNQARKVIMPLVDFIFYLANDIDAPETDIRRIYCRHSLSLECGSRQKYFPEAIDEVSYDGIQMAYLEARRIEEEMTNEQPDG